MSSPAVLDIDALVQPIPGDAPAGVPLPDAMRFELDDLRKDADPLDPATAGRRADWQKIIRIATDALANKSKDYLLAVRLLEAVTKKHGAAGLRDGLRLLQRLGEECWENIHPIPGEGETYDVREGIFKWINDVGRAAKFPTTINELPLVKGGGSTFGYIDTLIPERKTEFDDPAKFGKIEPASVKTAYEDLQEAVQALRDLAATLDTKMGSDIAPDFLSAETTTNIGCAIQNCIVFVEQVAKRRGVSLGDATEEKGESSPGDAASDGDGGGTGSSFNISGGRDGLYAQLSRIASSLKQIEPHSPVPYLIERCVRMGSMAFPDLMRAMVREHAALDELDRLLGMEAPPTGE